MIQKGHKNVHFALDRPLGDVEAVTAILANYDVGFDVRWLQGWGWRANGFALGVSMWGTWGDPDEAAPKYLADLLTEHGFRGRFIFGPDYLPTSPAVPLGLYTYLVGSDEPYDAEVVRARRELDNKRIDAAVQEHLDYCRLLAADPLAPAALRSNELWERYSIGPVKTGTPTWAVFLDDGASPAAVAALRVHAEDYYEMTPTIVTPEQIEQAVREALDSSSSSE